VGEVAFEGYRHLSVIVAGGQGTARSEKGRDLVIGRGIAIKTLTTKLGIDPSHWQRSSPDAPAAARAAEPHVASLYDPGTIDAQHSRDGDRRRTGVHAVAPRIDDTRSPPRMGATDRRNSSKDSPSRAPKAACVSGTRCTIRQIETQLTARLPLTTQGATP
jgi:hypothetical protein